MILLDTHALLWWALDPDRLSPAARERVAEMERAGGYASSISIWELGVKLKRNKLELPITIDELARRIERGAVVELLPSIPRSGCAAWRSPGSTAIPPIA